MAEAPNSISPTRPRKAVSVIPIICSIIRLIRIGKVIVQICLYEYLVFILLYCLEKESRATKIGCPAFLEYDSGIIPYFLFCLCCCSSSCCFCIASRRAANPVFFICFGSFFFASRIASNLVSSVVLQSRIIVPTLISVDTK